MIFNNNQSKYKVDFIKKMGIMKGNSHKILKTRKKVKIHVGCGVNYLEGYINIDSSAMVKPDIVADICKLPFEDSSIDEIYTAHTLEHVNDFEKAMRELHRVLKTGGVLKIIVPYPSSNYAFIPQHLHYFGWNSFKPFKKSDGMDYYYDFHFSEVEQKFSFRSLNKVISSLANKHPFLYENSFLKALFPAFELHVEMIK
jgi:SAM-dependent methyltransferase